MTDPSMELFASCPPAVMSGRALKIGVKQSLKDGNTALLGLGGQSTVTVEAQGPRFVLSAADVVGVYRAAGSSDSPDEFLPHVALARRTLPWERFGPDTRRRGLLCCSSSSPSSCPPAICATGKTLELLTLAELKKRDGRTHKRIVLSKQPIAADERLPVAFLHAHATGKLLKLAEVTQLCHMKRVTQIDEGAWR